MKAFKIILLVLLTALLTTQFERVFAQSGNVIFLGAISGTTTANCGTPSLPALCIVATGVYVCPNSTGCSTAASWIALGTAAATGVQKVNGVSPGATGDVTIGCAVPIPSSTGSFTAGTSTTLTVPGQTITATCAGTGS